MNGRFKSNGLVAVAVAVVAMSGGARAGFQIVDPNAAAAGDDLSTFYLGVTLSTVSPFAISPSVLAVTNGGGNVFGWSADAGQTDQWFILNPPGTSPPVFRVELATAAQAVNLFATSEYAGTLQAFDGLGNLLGTAAYAPNATSVQFAAGGNAVRAFEFQFAGNFNAPNNALLQRIEITTLDSPTSAVPMPPTVTLAAGFAAIGIFRRRF